MFISKHKKLLVHVLVNRRSSVVGSIVPVSIVTQPWHNILVSIQMAVHSASYDLNLWISLSHGFKSLRGTDQVKEKDPARRYTRVLKHTYCSESTASSG